MDKNSIAFYLQHYLSPSMTFIYRQLKGVSKEFNPIVLVSNVKENIHLFPFDGIFFKGRRKYHSFYNRLKRKITKSEFHYLNIDPKLNKSQVKFFNSIINYNKVKLIHAHFGPSGIEVLPIAKSLNIPLVVTFHGYDASALLNSKNYLENLKKLIRYAHIVSVSELIKNRLIDLGVTDDKITIIRCGIPVEDFRFKERPPISKKLNNNSKIIFLQVSNFVEKKGHFYTIKAFDKLLEKYTNLELWLAGSGEKENNIRQLVNNLGIQNKVIFFGKVSQPEVISLMDKADVFLHHSIKGKDGNEEGIPTVLMEAMSSGLPVVSTYHAGIPELIEHNKTGFLVEEKNIEEYVNVIEQILNAQDLANIINNARTKIINCYDHKTQSNKLIDLYTYLINNNK